MYCDNCERKLTDTDRVVTVDINEGSKTLGSFTICFNCVKKDIGQYLPMLKMFNRDAYEKIKQFFI